MKANYQTLSLRMPVELRQKLQVAADCQELSLNAYITNLLSARIDAGEIVRLQALKLKLQKKIAETDIAIMALETE